MVFDQSHHVQSDLVGFKSQRGWQLAGPLFAKTAAVLLVKVPSATDGAIAVLPEVHVGLAVAVPNGLLVPVIRDADTLDLFGIARALAMRAQDEGFDILKLFPAEAVGGIKLLKSLELRPTSSNCANCSPSIVLCRVSMAF